MIVIESMQTLPLCRRLSAIAPLISQIVDVYAWIHPFPNLHPESLQLEDAPRGLPASLRKDNGASLRGGVNTEESSHVGYRLFRNDVAIRSFDFAHRDDRHDLSPRLKSSRSGS